MPATSAPTGGAAPIAVPTLHQLKAMTVDECAELAGQIRGFLIEQVTRTGGHLGANLSTVELTIALHRAFRSPGTRLIWDTGHQAYTHKLLTGRVNRFTSLRRRHGLSGFPSRQESPHDLLENSHASVGPAWAYGVAAAGGSEGPTVVVLGDGALTGGVAYEALNAIGYRRAPVIVVLNDNGRSYAPTPSQLTYGEPLSGSGRCNVPERSEVSDGSDGTEQLERPARFFESLGLRYLGPVDGHDIAALDRALRWASDGPTPSVVHIRTQKGNGWPAALADEAKRLHDVGPLHGAGDPRARPAARGWSAVVRDLLCELAETDPRVHVITAAMPDTLGLQGFQARFPERYHDLGIAEQACVAFGAGLASQGKRPFFAVVTTFLTRAMDQLLYDVALHRLPVVFLLDRAGVTGPDGPSHHGAYDVGLLRNVPGAEVYSPSFESDLVDILKGALNRDHGPVIVRYPKAKPHRVDDPLPERDGLIRGGADACLVCHGSTADMVFRAARELQDRHGLHVAVWRMQRIHPMESSFTRYAAHQRLVIPVEELGASSGLAGALAAELATSSVHVPRIRPLTLPAGFLPHGTRDELLDEFGFTTAGIRDFVLSAIRGYSA